jgi:iron complex transport system ATP-binding protein
MPAILDIHRATVYRGEICALTDFSLIVEEGENLAILGPNGSGKSTLLKLMAGEVHPVPNDATRIRLFGEERWNVWGVRKRLGMVSHDLQHQYMDQVTGLKVILSGFYASIGIYGHQDFSYAQLARADDMLQEMGAGSLKDRRFGEMSTGEQRRCLLGRALVHEPTALVLDEPTSGLDLTATFHYLDLVRAYIRKGKTLLLVTHHIHEIPPDVKRVVLLKQGKVLQDGEKDSVLTEANLSLLFDCPVALAQANGWYQVLQGTAHRTDFDHPPPNTT